MFHTSLVLEEMHTAAQCSESKGCSCWKTNGDLLSTSVGRACPGYNNNDVVPSSRRNLAETVTMDEA